MAADLCPFDLSAGSNQQCPARLFDPAHDTRRRPRFPVKWLFHVKSLDIPDFGNNVRSVVTELCCHTTLQDPMSKRQKVPMLHTRSTVSVPFPVADGSRVVRAAQASGKAVSAFIREAALERADRVLAKVEKTGAPAVA